MELIPGAAPVLINVFVCRRRSSVFSIGSGGHEDDRQLLVQFVRILRDRAALAGAEEGVFLPVSPPDGSFL